MIYSRSKKMAWYIVIITPLLVIFAILKDMEGLASAIFSTGITAGAGLYGLKLHNQRKERLGNSQ